jgi:hypothetical protein
LTPRLTVGPSVRNERNNLKKRRLWSALVATLAILPAALSEAAEPSPSPSPPDGMPSLEKMAQFLGKTQKFSVTIREGYDVVQDSGQKIEFGAIRKVLVSRPDHLRIDVEKRDGEKNLVIFDGKAISIYNAKDKIYATAPKEGTLDDAIKYAVVDLGLKLPLAMMLVSTLPDEIQARVVEAEYVETTTMGGVPCDHIAARTSQGVYFQVWIAQGDEALPHRIVITYADQKGQPQFWADFSAWNLSPEVSASSFQFTPPDGAEKVQFLSQIQNLVPTAHAKKGKK